MVHRVLLIMLTSITSPWTSIFDARASTCLLCGRGVFRTGYDHSLNGHPVRQEANLFWHSFAIDPLDKRLWIYLHLKPANSHFKDRDKPYDQSFLFGFVCWCKRIIVWRWERCQYLQKHIIWLLRHLLNGWRNHQSKASFCGLHKTGLFAKQGFVLSRGELLKEVWQCLPPGSDNDDI